jgi:hypothetical protein
MSKIQIEQFAIETYSINLNLKLLKKTKIYTLKNVQSLCALMKLMEDFEGVLVNPWWFR